MSYKKFTQPFNISKEVENIIKSTDNSNIAALTDLKDIKNGSYNRLKNISINKTEVPMNSVLINNIKANMDGSALVSCNVMRDKKGIQKTIHLDIKVSKDLETGSFMNFFSKEIKKAWGIIQAS